MEMLISIHMSQSLVSPSNYYVMKILYKERENIYRKKIECLPILVQQIYPALPDMPICL